MLVVSQHIAASKDTKEVNLVNGAVTIYIHSTLDFD